MFFTSLLPSKVPGVRTVHNPVIKTKQESDIPDPAAESWALTQTFLPVSICFLSTILLQQQK